MDAARLQEALTHALRVLGIAYASGGHGSPRWPVEVLVAHLVPLVLARLAQQADDA